MAFVLQKKGAWSTTTNPGAPWAIGVASDTDTLATMSASGYLQALDKELRIGDLIYFKATDGNEFVEVTAVTPNLTVQSALQPGTDLPLADASIFVGNVSNKAAPVVMSGDATIDNVGAVTLSAGVKGAQFVLRSGEFTTVGGAATENFTVAGALVSDVVLVMLRAPGAVAVTVLYSYVFAADTIQVVFSADPAADHQISFAVFRTVS